MQLTQSQLPHPATPSRLLSGFRGGPMELAYCQLPLTAVCDAAGTPPAAPPRYTQPPPFEAARWSWHTASSLSSLCAIQLVHCQRCRPAPPARYTQPPPFEAARGGPMELAYCQLPLIAMCEAAGTPPAAPPPATLHPAASFRGGPMELTCCQLPPISPRIAATQ
jgi:hypothetical protein